MIPIKTISAAVLGLMLAVPALADERLREVIDAVLAGEDVLMVLPTGFGKSACYQIPSMVLPRPVVVISPLLANVYLHWLDVMFHRPAGPARWANAKLVRYADDCNIYVGSEAAAERLVGYTFIRYVSLYISSIALWPSVSLSATLSTRSLEICEMCTSPPPDRS